MNDIGYHEPVEELSTHTRSLHRALLTVMEELEAVDWYQQRADVAADDDLKAILIHHRDEEMEHAVMVLEWLRRRIPTMDEMFRTYLFTDAPIVAIEEGGAGKGSSAGPAAERDLGIGILDAGDDE